VIEVNKYNALRVEEFNGTYYIVLGYKNKEGKFSPQFCKCKFKDEEKTAPISIPIGTIADEQYKRILQSIIMETGEDSGAPF
jgi:hypothetical protein